MHIFDTLENTYSGTLKLYTGEYFMLISKGHSSKSDSDWQQSQLESLIWMVHVLRARVFCIKANIARWIIISCDNGSMAFGYRDFQK